MKLSGHVDHIDMFSIQGWAAQDDEPTTRIAVDILHNHEAIASIEAKEFRPDLLAAAVSDGHSGFSFNPFEFLEEGENKFEVRFADTGELLLNGQHSIWVNPDHLTTSPATESMSRSKKRWRGAEPDQGLTWGSYMTGDSFWDEVGKHMDLSELSSLNLLEIGPGYGRLLATLIERRQNYASYTGLELSEQRVRLLDAKYGNQNTRFIHGDAMTDEVGSALDLIFSSATFEHLYPSFSDSLMNLRRQMAPGARVCIDFVQMDPEMCHSSALFEPQGGAFVRIYSQSELQCIFRQCDLTIESVSSICLGTHMLGSPVNRIFVYATLAP